MKSVRLSSMSFLTLNQKIAAFLNGRLALTPLTAGHVTTLFMGAGLWAGYFFSRGTRAHMALGALFFHLAWVLRACADRARAEEASVRPGVWYGASAELIVLFSLWSGSALGAVSLGVPGDAVRGWWLAALSGSAIYFVRAAGERLLRAGNSANASAREQDPTLAVYLFALPGSPWLLLLAGAVVMNVLWILRWKRKTTPTS